MKRLEIERAGNGQYLWRFIANNGRTVSWSGEYFHNLADCVWSATLGSPVTLITPEERQITYYDANTHSLQQGVYAYIDKYTTKDSEKEGE